MAQALPENQNRSLELRFKRWTAVAVVCFMGLLAALPFRSTPSASGPPVAPSHRERSLRFRADSEAFAPTQIEHDSRPLIPEASKTPAPRPTATVAPAIHRVVPKDVVPKDVDPVASDRAEQDEPRVVESPIEPTEEKSLPCTARRGENLMDVAERALGDRRRWKELMELNPEHRSAFDELTEGETIVLPEGR